MTCEYAVVYQASGDEDRVESCHRTEGAAQRAAERAQRRFERGNPHDAHTTLLAGYSAVRRGAHGWEPLDGEEPTDW